MASDNAISKTAQRLARADGKTLGRLSAAERAVYEQRAKQELASELPSSST